MQRWRERCPSRFRKNAVIFFRKAVSRRRTDIAGRSMQGPPHGRGRSVGIVVLKRLEDALAYGDTIYAVIKASPQQRWCEQNRYTAPGVEGQAEVIATAQAMAGFAPETIGYIEAHGTGTPLGDPVEIEGLTKAFRFGTAKKNFCAIGSVKAASVISTRRRASPA